MKIVRMLGAFLCLSVLACATVGVSETEVKNLENEHIIGTFGTYSNNLLSSKFNEIGLPEFKGKIKLSVAAQEFNKNRLKDYNSRTVDAKKLQIIDSINLRPTYFRMSISDKVGFVEALNNPDNDELKEYLAVTKNNVVLTEALIYFPEDIASILNAASEVYLVNDKVSSYSLELLMKDKKIHKIDFRNGTSFGYVFSDVCWKEDYRSKAVVAAISVKGEGCPGNSKKNPDKVYSKDVFDKMK